jgi:hypothetical protein
MSRYVTLIVAIPASLAVGAVLPGLVAKLRSPAAPGNAGAEKSEQSGGAGGGLIRLAAEQIDAAKMETRKVDPGVLKRQITVPAAVTPDTDRVARVATGALPLSTSPASAGIGTSSKAGSGPVMNEEPP